MDYSSEGPEAIPNKWSVGYADKEGTGKHYESFANDEDSHGRRRRRSLRLLDQRRMGGKKCGKKSKKGSGKKSKKGSGKKSKKGDGCDQPTRRPTPAPIGESRATPEPFSFPTAPPSSIPSQAPVESRATPAPFTFTPTKPPSTTSNDNPTNQAELTPSMVLSPTFAV
eukprot:CAMPEP_0185723892 /NCGR_PEP_ID=MMETSP1171-20130828/575_1 /TAXON_ID=374046 /ORGANISM="Helicotheca tamensis, Strain CCMP826" /LENGTH=167 /DNA_ID=CAMNT_0028391659 /DNA_START=109 /DNA_END=612 /DNA_ORIENTATION=+